MLHIPLLVMDRRNKTEFAIYISLMWSLFPRNLTNQNLCIFTAAGIVPCGGRKTSPHTSSQCRLYFLVLWDHSAHFSHLKIEFRLSRCCAFHYWSINRVCYFHFFHVVLVSK